MLLEEQIKWMVHTDIRVYKDGSQWLLGSVWKRGKGGLDAAELELPAKAWSTAWSLHESLSGGREDHVQGEGKDRSSSEGKELSLPSSFPFAPLGQHVLAGCHPQGIPVDLL